MPLPRFSGKAAGQRVTILGFDSPRLHPYKMPSDLRLCRVKGHFSCQLTGTLVGGGPSPLGMDDGRQPVRCLRVQTPAGADASSCAGPAMSPAGPSEMTGQPPGAPDGRTGGMSYVRCRVASILRADGKERS